MARGLLGFGIGSYSGEVCAACDTRGRLAGLPIGGHCGPSALSRLESRVSALASWNVSTFGPACFTVLLTVVNVSS